MRLNSGTLIFIVVLLVVIVGAFVLLNQEPAAPVTPTTAPDAPVVAQLFPNAVAANVTAVTINSRRAPAEVPVVPNVEATPEAEATAEATAAPEATAETTEAADADGTVLVTFAIQKDEAGIWQLGSASTIETNRALLQPTIEQALPTLTALRSADQFTVESGELANFGLDNPTHDVRFTVVQQSAAEATPEVDGAAPTTTYRLRVGNRNPQGTSYYALLGDDESTIYLVSNAAGIDNILNWTTNPPFAVPPTPTPQPVLNLPGPIFTSFQAQSLVRFTATENATGDAVTFSRPENTPDWIIEQAPVDISGRQPDTTLITVAIADFATLAASSGANVQDLSTLGLAEPAYTFLGETTTGETYRLRVGNLDPTGTRYYALVNDFETVVELDRAVIDNLISLIDNPPLLPAPSVESTAEATAEATADSAAAPETTAEATVAADVTAEVVEVAQVEDEATEEPAEATEVVEMTEEPAEATEVVEMTEEPAEATEVVEMTEEPAEATEVVEMTEEPLVLEGTIVGLALEQDNLTTLVTAVTEAELIEPLATGDFVVFAPTDEAFAAALEALQLELDDLLDDTETLTAILTYHVVPQETFQEALDALSDEDTESVEVETVNGETLTITVNEDGEFTVNGVIFDDAAEADNGVVYIIEDVLLPTLPVAAEMTPEATEAAQ